MQVNHPVQHICAKCELTKYLHNVMLIHVNSTHQQKQ
ncbi:50S ribosomal protein L36, partial [Staphylococcus aureus]